MAMSTLTLKGVTCANCANSVSNALHSVQGVRNFDVDLFDHVAVISFDDDETTDGVIREAIDDANCAIH